MTHVEKGRSMVVNEKAIYKDKDVNNCGSANGSQQHTQYVYKTM